MTHYPIGKLPPDAEAELMAAAQLADPRERQAAIEKAQARARVRYPSLFRREGTMKVRVENVRLAFLNAFEAKSIAGGTDKFYSARAIIPPKHKAVKLLDDAILAVAKEKWGAKAEQVIAKLTKDDVICWRKDDYLNKENEVYDGFEGMFHLGATNKARPTVVDRDKTPLTATDGRPYSGCMGTLVVDIWAQDNGFGRRINASLMGLQFVADGDAFSGGRPASADDFEDLADGVDDEVEEEESALA